MSHSHKRVPLLLVMGHGPGLGTELSHTFSQAGYRVAGVSRGIQTADARDRALPSRWTHRQCDVTDRASVEACINGLIEEQGAPNVVVYNPMQLQVRPFLEVSAEEFESVWRVTCFGAMLVAHAVLPAMLGAGGGTLIFTGATASIRGSAKFASLATAKFGLRGLAQSLAREFGPQGIHVVHTILDGLIWSPQTLARFSPEEGRCMAPSAIARSYLDLARQPTSCWTHELDLRPFNGTF